MSLFDKWYEKKAVKLGYIKEEEIKENLTTEVSKLEMTKNSFDPRISALEDYSLQLKARMDKLEHDRGQDLKRIYADIEYYVKDLKDRDVQILEEIEKQRAELDKIDAEQADKIKKVEGWYKVAAELRERIEKLEKFENQFGAIFSSLTNLETKQAELNKTLNRLSKAKADIFKMEKAIESYDELHSLNERAESTEKKITEAINKNSISNKKLDKDLKALEKRVSGLRINGKALTGRTEIVASDIRISKDSNETFDSEMQLRFLEQFKRYKNELDKDYKEKQIPWDELKKEIKATDQRIDDLTKINRNAGKIVMGSQKSFNKLFQEVMEKQKRDGIKRKL